LIVFHGMLASAIYVGCRAAAALHNGQMNA
jgi:hypothetical protein